MDRAQTVREGDAEMAMALRAFPAWDGDPRRCMHLFRCAHMEALEMEYKRRADQHFVDAEEV
jgi:hypothetical protein